MSLSEVISVIFSAATFCLVIDYRVYFLLKSLNIVLCVNLRSKASPAVEFRIVYLKYLKLHLLSVSSAKELVNDKMHFLTSLLDSELRLISEVVFYSLFRCHGLINRTIFSRNVIWLCL